MYVDITMPGGVLANGTPRQCRGRWRLSHLVRTPDGQNLQPMGGWVQRGATLLTGACRAAIAWRDNSKVRWLGFGTHSKVYVQTASAVVSDITPVGFTAGRADAVAEGGYGAGPYGVDAYGTARTDAENVEPATVLTLEAWGQDLIFCSADDGKLYIWTLNTANPATQITNSPIGCNGLSVSQERFIFAYGAGADGRNIAWCDQGNETIWAAASGNQAGDIDLDTEGNFQFGRKLQGGAHLHFTEVDVWVSTYQNAEVVYGFQKAGDKCGPLSYGAVCAIDSRCAWMGRGSFFLFTGVVQPLPSDARDYVFSDFNYTQASKVTSYHDGEHGEVWWFYPSGASDENDSYVLWNYTNNQWWVGDLGRTAAVGAGVFQYPVEVDATGTIWEHEQGFTYSGAATPFARSGPLEWPSDSGMAEGDDRIMVKGFVGDEGNLGDSQITFYTKDFPNLTETAFGPYAITTAPIDLLFTTRQVEIEVTFTGMDDARFGVMRVDAKPISKR